jgi:hypothetical protein
MQIKLLVEVFGKHDVIKKGVRNDTVVVKSAVAILLAEGRLVSGIPRLKREHRLVIGKATQ